MWADTANPRFRVLKAGEYTNQDKDDGDFVYVQRKWHKCSSSLYFFNNTCTVTESNGSASVSNESKVDYIPNAAERPRPSTCSEFCSCSSTEGYGKDCRNDLSCLKGCLGTSKKSEP